MAELRYRQASILVALALATLLITANASAVCLIEISTKRFRVGTFNTALKPWPAEESVSGCGRDWWGTPDERCRVRRIASQIIASNYDFVILNEVFDEDARDEFWRTTAFAYPHQIAKLYDSGPTGRNEDSGLMLLSKFPFAERPTGQPACVTENAHIERTPTSYLPWLGFRGFGDASFYADRLAAKGVGFAVLKASGGDACGPGNIAVFFTHTQASYSATSLCDGDAEPDAFTEEVSGPALPTCYLNWLSEAGVRETQMGIISDYMKCVEPALAGGHAANVILAGDLNINGDLSNPFELTNLEAMGKSRRHNRLEYDTYFRTGTPNSPLSGTFFSEVMKDSWRTSMVHYQCDNAATGVPGCPADAPPGAPPPYTGTSQWDRGFTIQDPGNEERLDYILADWRTDPDLALCPQHVTQAWNLNNPGGAVVGGISTPSGALGIGYTEALSDHFGLNAEFEWAAPHCSPRLAAANFSSGDAYSLEHLASVQWFYFPEPGTYTINVDPANWLPSQGGPPPTNDLDFAVYDKADLSRPVAPRKETGLIPGDSDFPPAVDKSFSVPEAPFFVKVFRRSLPPLAQSSTPYDFRFKKNECTSIEDACDIRPYNDDPANTDDVREWKATAPDYAWFSIKVDRPDSVHNGTQFLSFFVAEEVVPGASPSIQSIELIQSDGSSLPLAPADGGGPQTLAEEDYRFGPLRRYWRVAPFDYDLDMARYVEERPGRWYLKVRRAANGPVPQDFQFWVGWQTNLTWVLGNQPNVLKCDDTQEWGHDEVWFKAEVDYVGCLPQPSNSFCDDNATSGVEVATIEDGDSQSFLDKLLTSSATNYDGVPLSLINGIRFAHHVDLIFLEDDRSYDEVGRLTIPALGPTGARSVESGGDFSLGGGEYFAKVNVSHWRDGEVCNTDADCNSKTKCLAGVCY